MVGIGGQRTGQKNDQEEKYQEEKDELNAQRLADEEGFKETIAEKIKEQGEYLKDLREKDPEKFKEVTTVAYQEVAKRQAARRLVMESFTEDEKRAFAQKREGDPEAELRCRLFCRRAI